MPPLSRSRLFLGALLLLHAPARAQDSATVARRVDSLFAQYNQGTSPGVAVAIVRDGRIAFSKGYGLADIEHRIPITSTSVFDVASVSKQFAGLAIAMLVEQGRIRLTDDVKKYIPELGDLGHTITIDHLVHHTSGLRDWPGTLALSGWRMDDVISFDQILTMAYHQRSLNFVPGSEYTYSNTGYNLLAEVVARVTGKSFRAWTQENLFQPLGMTRSVFRDDHTLVVPDRVFGYARRPDGTWASVPNNLTALGSSSLMTTAEDLARWVINFEDARVGGKSAMTLMRQRGTFNDGTSNAYAFGVSHGTYRDVPTVSHSGGWASFATYLVHFPEQRLGVIVLANSGIINPGRAAFNVADIFLTGRANTPAPAPNDSQVVAPSTLDRYAGVYRLGPGWYVRIRRDGAVLRTQATREAEFVMTARSDTSFWVAAYNAPMDFHPSNGTEPTTLIYRGRRHPRLEDSPSPSAAQLAELAGEYESAELATTYRVEVVNGALVMKHRRHGTISLAHLWRNEFGGGVWFVRAVEFERDGAGKVTGFSVTVDERSRDIRFARKN
jgi:CubicO group peptidase (beta-lactamase class C family)